LLRVRDRERDRDAAAARLQLKGGDDRWWAMDMAKAISVDGARKQEVRLWAGMPQTVSFAVVGSVAGQKP
jgi:hypothetical protein